jgi:ATP-dependent Clp protease ATP-binding subunit ClpA
MFNRLRTTAAEVIVRAKREAEGLGHARIGTEHLLLALLDEQAGIAYAVLHEAGVEHQQVRADVQRLLGASTQILGEDDAAALRTIGIDLDAVLARIEQAFGSGALQPARPASRRGLLRRTRGSWIKFSPHARKVWELSIREAVGLGHDYLGPEHLLLGVLREGDGLAVKILTQAGLTLDDLRAATLTALGKAA